MPKISVYVDDELKARMDKLPTVNWSATAQRAYAKECSMKEIHLSSGDEIYKDAIIRLRASKSKFEEDNEKAGFDAGRKWAMNDASYEDMLYICDENEFTDHDHLAKMIAEEFENADFWSNISPRFRRINPDDEYVYNFIKGVSTVWDAIADKI